LMLFVVFLVVIALQKTPATLFLRGDMTKTRRGENQNCHIRRVAQIFVLKLLGKQK